MSTSGEGQRIKNHEYIPCPFLGNLFEEHDVQFMQRPESYYTGKIMLRQHTCRNMERFKIQTVGM